LEGDSGIAEEEGMMIEPSLLSELQVSSIVGGGDEVADAYRDSTLEKDGMRAQKPRSRVARLNLPPVA
jgi:hypothetical protein